MGTSETWRAIPGLEGYYEVSDHGNVRSVGRVVVYKNGAERWHSGRVLAQRTNKDGYQMVALYRNTKRCTRLVHRLVLEAFVGPCPPGMETRHLNNDPVDNRLENITWGTPSENNLDTVRAGNHKRWVSPLGEKMKQRTHCPRGHRLESPNLRADMVRKGKRACLSCDRARARLASRGRRFRSVEARETDEYITKFQRVSDEIHDQLFAEAQEHVSRRLVQLPRHSSPSDRSESLGNTSERRGDPIKNQEISHV